MPTLSVFYGIKIQMFWRDHPPPHFHATSEGSVVVIDIMTLAVLQGSLSPAKLALVLQWAKQNQQELLEAWELCTQQKSPNSITPLP